MPLPIPLHGMQGSSKTAGTGFLATDGVETWLVSCLHGIIYLLPRKRSSLLDDARFQVVGTTTIIPLFEKSGERFTVVPNTATGCLCDIIAVKLDSHEAQVLYGFEAYDLKTIVEPKDDEEVRAEGFPGMEQTLIRSSILDGRVTEIEGLSIKLDVPSQGGISGGALTSQRGLLGVIHGDTGPRDAMTNALAIALHVVRPVLFQ